MRNYILLSIGVMLYLYSKNVFHQITLKCITGQDLVNLKANKLNSIRILPSFSVADDANNLDALKTKRELYYVAGELDFRLVYSWMENFVNTISLSKIESYVSSELSFNTLIKELFRHSDVELLFGKFETKYEVFGLYLFTIVSILLLMEARMMDNTLVLFPCSRFIICVYGIGDKLMFDPQVAGVLQENAFFVVWSTFIGGLLFGLEMWNTVYTWTKKPGNVIYLGVVNISYTVYMTATFLHIFALLSYVIIPKAHQVFPTYLIMLTADALRTTMLYAQHACVTYNRENPGYGISETALKMAQFFGHFFEFLFVSYAIQHGLFVRNRIFVLILLPYCVHIAVKARDTIWENVAGV
ncbi:unnamed protein product [Bursaphelenchus okinawaensis]|uniref:Uncharacterized protein n=1 Tax=Bursaphelenchus okinawaensis TaxID=465554 RepID=A0A811JWE1_9BILA|nr:unnamed protein product [Bursaphelenchus okinawaensis]CAG9086718.1 unnamed protein product [Bursaphelenchus okinawaensis]